MNECISTPNCCVWKFKESIPCLTFSNSLFILFRVVIVAWCLGDETPKGFIWVFKEDGMYGVYTANFGVGGVRLL